MKIKMITLRKSTRVYEKNSIKNHDINNINQIVNRYNNFVGVFGNKFLFKVKILDNMVLDGKKFKTYGLLRNVQVIIECVINNDIYTMIDYGYIMEHLILDLTRSNYDTCIVGGTFDRSNYDVSLEDNEVLPCLITVGKRKHSSVINYVMKKALTDKRVKEEKLLLPNSVLNVINKEVLSNVRLAPSASNKQPWRLLLEDNKIHVFLKRTCNYPPIKLEYDIQMVDIGIALSHIEITLNHNNVVYDLIQEDIGYNDHIYICTYSIKTKMNKRKRSYK